MYVYVCVCVCVCVCMYIYIYIYIYKHSPIDSWPCFLSNYFAANITGVLYNAILKYHKIYTKKSKEHSCLPRLDFLLKKDYKSDLKC